MTIIVVTAVLTLLAFGLALCLRRPCYCDAPAAFAVARKVRREDAPAGRAGHFHKDIHT